MPDDFHDDEDPRSLIDDTDRALARYLGAKTAVAFAIPDFFNHDLARAVLANPDLLPPPPRLGSEPADLDRLNLQNVLGDHVYRRAVAADLDATEAELRQEWRRGRDTVWPDAMVAAAYRSIGNISGATHHERHNERRVAKLRKQARRRR